MTHRLYYAPGACSLAPHIILEELGVPYELRLVRTSQGEHHQPAYLSINPRARIPALDSGDRILTENVAILLFLGNLRPHLGLLPEDDVAHSRCVEFLSWLSNTVHVAYAQILRPQRFVLDQTLYSKVSECGVDNLKRCFAEIETALGAARFSVTDHFSVVDAFLLVFYRWGNRLQWPMRDEYPRWSALTGRVLKRESVITALNQEGITIEA